MNNLLIFCIFLTALQPCLAAKFFKEGRVLYECAIRVNHHDPVTGDIISWEFTDKRVKIIDNGKKIFIQRSYGGFGNGARVVTQFRIRKKKKWSLNEQGVMEMQRHFYHPGYAILSLLMFPIEKRTLTIDEKRGVISAEKRWLSIEEDVVSRISYYECEAPASLDGTE
ncbi:MAG: hypothetical protein HOE90_05815 [Bacteriovoracaceae bacterium]|nr:hypothetical protein [Bacteriovoracaceae bacterium]